MEPLTKEALEKINANLKRSEEIATELLDLAVYYKNVETETAFKEEKEKSMIEKSLSALINQLDLLEEPLGALIQSIPITPITLISKSRISKEQKPRIKAGRKGILKITRIPTLSGKVYISSKNKKQYLESLGIEAKILKKIKSKISKNKVPKPEVIKASPMAHVSNKIFYKLSKKLSKTTLFKSVEKDLRKANMPYLLSSYISMVLLVTSLTFLISFAISFFFITSPLNIVRNLLIAIALTATSFFLAVSWPASIISSNNKKIEAELPFAVSHMAAIASSKIEPSKIFSIMSLAKEYKLFSSEAKKVINQINIYGYNLTTALRNSAKSCPNKNLSELWNGMATAITTGGNLSTYLKEKSKSILLDYKLTRERYTNVIGLYSDIYTALLIAAPLILMLLLVIMSVLGSSFIGMPISTLSNIGIIGIAVLNIIFLVFLHFTQPEI